MLAASARNETRLNTFCNMLLIITFHETASADDGENEMRQTTEKTRCYRRPLNLSKAKGGIMARSG